MSSDIFDAQGLAEKLSKLNNSQQSIESLSRWCILHRKKARQIVETWDKLFNSSQKDQRVSFLYLANDILQNSRRKGSEFVNEFWKVLPAALKQVYDIGEEQGKKAVTRLVGIWEERKVFGSRGQGLKDEMLGKNPSPLLVSNGKSSNPIKITKRDANSVRIKLAVGGLPEKILTAFQSVIDEHLNEEAAINKCSAAVSNVAKIREELEIGPSLGNQQVAIFMDELQAQESALHQCVEKLESAESTRAMLISQLKEAIEDQESKQGFVHAQLQTARGRIEQVVNLKSRLAAQIAPGPSATTTIPMSETTKIIIMEHNAPPIQPTSTPPQSHLAQPVVSFAPVKTASDEESKKAAAAAVAAKLAASTSSAQMLTSVLSSLVAEEAMKSSGFTGSLPLFSPEKRQKLEHSVSLSDNNSNVANMAYFNTLQQQSGTVVPSSSMQSMAQGNQIQTSFGALPALQPPTSMGTGNPQSNQYVQSNGMMVGVMPYGYGGGGLPPPPPLPPHIAMGLGRPGSGSQQQQQQNPTVNGGYYRPPGIGFYGQNHQSSTPPVPRQ
ncbi:uncharacterized protein [Euphorbia lathyris]|uniref:uncharacterized protein n=1 Tax=Euphorbia lathyris TaxID=212925 RepID=UPI00331352A8